MAGGELTAAMAPARTIFASGEAEAMVRRIREHLRAAEAARQTDDGRTAKRADERAEDETAELLARLTPRLEREARAAFPNEDALAEDALVEMIMVVRCRLRDLSAGQSLWGTVFNLAAKRARQDAMRTVHHENGRDEHGRPNTQVISLSQGDTGQDSLAEMVASPEAAAALDRVLGRVVTAELLARLPSPRHARVLELRFGAGRTFPEIAAELGVSERTARTYNGQALGALRDLASSRDWNQEAG